MQASILYQIQLARRDKIPTPIEDVIEEKPLLNMKKNKHWGKESMINSSFSDLSHLPVAVFEKSVKFYCLGFIFEKFDLFYLQEHNFFPFPPAVEY